MIGVINDIHVDPRRVGGTTEASREALQQYVLDRFRELLIAASENEVLIILGDLFNRQKVDNWVFYQTLQLIQEFCDNTPACKVLIVRGNHDSKSQDKESLCSLELLGKLLGEKVELVFDRVYNFTTNDDKNHRIIPHMFNQAEFDLAITRVDNTVDFLYIHSNVDNPFATGDHSLNLSKDQVKTLHDRNVTVICGHEHQHRRPFHNVVVVGNQIATSVADCKGDKQKSWLQIQGDKVVRIPFWEAAGNFYDVDYADLDAVPVDAQFVRVHGESPKGAFTKIVQDINKFRVRSNAFVVSNAVSIVVEDKKVSAEDINKINVIEMLINAVPEQFRARVLACQGEG